MQRTSDAAEYLYRIIRFEHLVRVLQSGEWIFAHPSEWEDPYENRVQNSISNALFAQCWCRKGVSDAMWRIYSKDNLGVRIRTKKSTIQSSLIAAALKDELGVRIAKVKYVNSIEYELRANEIDLALKKRATVTRASAHLFLKRAAFEHEAETRIVIFDPRIPAEAKLRRLVVKMDSHKIIESVLVDPRAPEEFLNAYRYYLKDKLHFAGPVRKSTLYQSGEQREL